MYMLTAQLVFGIVVDEVVVNCGFLKIFRRSGQRIFLKWKALSAAWGIQTSGLERDLGNAITKEHMEQDMDLIKKSAPIRFGLHISAQSIFL